MKGFRWHLSKLSRPTSAATFLTRCSKGAFLFSFGAALASEPAVNAKLRNIVASAWDIAYAGSPVLTFDFDILLTNRSEKAVRLPASLSARKQGLALLGASSLASDQTWQTFYSADWVGTSGTQYESCVDLPPGETRVLQGGSGRVIFPKPRLNSLGSEPSLRFVLWLFRGPQDGRSALTVVTTEPFRVRIPGELTK